VSGSTNATPTSPTTWSIRLMAATTGLSASTLSVDVLAAAVVALCAVPGEQQLKP